jgi:hypothetical protein
MTKSGNSVSVRNRLEPLGFANVSAESITGNRVAVRQIKLDQHNLKAFFKAEPDAQITLMGDADILLQPRTNTFNFWLLFQILLFLLLLVVIYYQASPFFMKLLVSDAPAFEFTPPPSQT